MVLRAIPRLALAAAILAGCGDDSTSGKADAHNGYQYDIVPDPGDAGSDAADDATAPQPDAGPDVADAAEPEDLPPVEDVAEDVPPLPDVPADTGPEPDVVPPVDVPVPFTHCSPPGGDRNVYDLRDPQCPDHISPPPISQPGVPVTLKGVVATAVFGDTVFVQEAAGGPYSGMAVFAHGIFTGDVAPGDVLDVEGSWFEFFDASQLYLTEWTVVSHGEVPEPFVPPHPAHLATGGALAELFEGVLVQVQGVETIHTKPDCPHEFGEFLVSGGLRVDDKGVHWDARLGDEFATITGPLAYTFGNTKIEPRTLEDLDATQTGSSSSLSKCIQGDCIVPADAPASHAVVITELMPDPFGEDTGQEWFELYNPGKEPVDVAGWQLRDCTTQKVQLIGADTVVPPKGYLVVGAKAEPALNGGVPVDLAYGTSYYLSNTIGSIVLFDAASGLVDQVRYSAFSETKMLQVGHSLERVSATADGSAPESWEPGHGTFGPTENEGTPGKKNSNW